MFIEADLWLQVVKAGGRVTPDDAVAAITGDANMLDPESVRAWPLIALARLLQWQIDLGDFFREEIVTGMLEVRSGGPARMQVDIRTAGELAVVFVRLLREVDYAKATDRNTLSDALQSALKEKKKEIRLADRDLPEYTEAAVTHATDFASQHGYKSLASLLALHNPKYLFAVTSTFDSDREVSAEPQKGQ